MKFGVEARRVKNGCDGSEARRQSHQGFSLSLKGDGEE